MTVKIRDENFLNSDELNLLDCVLSDRYLVHVQDALTIINVCQDIFNTSLVVVDFALTGTFKYQPKCRILEVDGEEYDVFAPLLESYYQATPLPLTTDCNVLQGKLCFDFSQVIPNFVSAETIKFELILEGSVPQSYGVSFTPNNPSAQYTWNKGRFPTPVTLSYSGGNLIVQFDSPPTTECSCNLQCVLPSGTNVDLTLCPDERQSIVIYQGSLTGQAQYINLTFKDSLENESLVNIQGLINTSIVPLSVSHNPHPFRNDIILQRALVNGDLINETAQYQIWKYEETVDNYRLWKDWSSRDWNNFVDYDVVPDKTYGYCVRFKGPYEDISNFSEWSIVNT